MEMINRKKAVAYWTFVMDTQIDPKVRSKYLWIWHDHIPTELSLMMFGAQP